MGMKTYKKLLTDRSTQMSMLEESEHNKFRQFVNNPQNTVTPSPQSQGDVPYSTRVLQQALAANPDLINTDISGRMYVDKKLVSDDPRQAGKIIHFITHDYSDLSGAPEGTKEVLEGLRRRGFNMRDIGNTYLRESVLGHTPLHDRKRIRLTPTTSTPRLPTRGLSQSPLAKYAPTFLSSHSPQQQVSPQIKPDEEQEPREQRGRRQQRARRDQIDDESSVLEEQLSTTPVSRYALRSRRKYKKKHK